MGLRLLSACLTSPVLSNAQCRVVRDVTDVCMATFCTQRLTSPVLSNDQCCVVLHRRMATCLRAATFLCMFDITGAKQCSVLCGASPAHGNVFARCDFFVHV